MRIIVQEEMKADTPGTMHDIYSWLGVQTDVPSDLRKVNTSKAVRSEGLRRVLRATPGGLKDAVPAGLRRAVSRRIRNLNSKHAARPALDPSLRARLSAEFAPEVARIESVLGRSVAAWHET